MKEIEELRVEKKITGIECRIDLSADDGWEYLVNLAARLWPFFISNIYVNDNISVTVDEFRYKLETGEIDISACKNYLDDVEIQNVLDTFGVNIRKFWFLCLWAKYQASKARNVPLEEDDIEYSTKKSIDSIIDKLEQFSKEKDSCCSIEFKIKGKKDTLKITKPIVFFCLKKTLKSFLEHSTKDKYLTGLLESHNTYKKTPCQTEYTAYFTAIMDEFFKPYCPDGDAILKKGFAKYHTRDLIARLIYILRIDDDKTYITGGHRYLQSKISRYINKVDFTTLEIF